MQQQTAGATATANTTAATIATATATTTAAAIVKQTAEAQE